MNFTCEHLQTNQHTRHIPREFLCGNNIRHRDKDKHYCPFSNEKLNDPNLMDTLCEYYFPQEVK